MGVCECDNTNEFCNELNSLEEITSEYCSSKKDKRSMNRNSNQKRSNYSEYITSDIPKMKEIKNQTNDNNKITQTKEIHGKKSDLLNSIFNDQSPSFRNIELNAENSGQKTKTSLEIKEKNYYNLSFNAPENNCLTSEDVRNFQFSHSLRNYNNDDYGIENMPQDEFSKYIFSQINEIRQNPTSFIPIIEDAKKNIVIDNSGIIIYKSSVKVALFKGEQSFDETIDFLSSLDPMQKLIYRPELVVPPPNNEEGLKNRKYMNEVVSELCSSGVSIKSYWRDIIKDRETCFILMIVDDTGLNGGMKRRDILDPETKYIGISSRLIGKSFASYVTLA